MNNIQLNWYSQFKTAAPLPEIVNKYPDDSFEGLRKMDAAFTQEDIRNIQEPDTSFLGAGYFGAAFNRANTVKKYTRDDSEYKNALTIMEIQKRNGNTPDNPIPHIVFVYNARQLKLTSDPKERRGYEWFEITIEKVVPLSMPEKRIYDIIFYEYRESIKRHINDPERIKKVVNEIYNSINNAIMDHKHRQNQLLKPQTENFQDVKTYEPFVEMVLQFVRHIHTNNIANVDMHCNNMGKRKNELVVLDLGAVGNIG